MRWVVGSILVVRIGFRLCHYRRYFVDVFILVLVIGTIRGIVIILLVVLVRDAAAAVAGL